MFFINHRQKETVKKDSCSRMNLHEASFIVALCKYLIQQGYETTQVTILAMYKAQLMKIKELLNGEPLLEQIRAATVDDYQGEENEIILVSFVRSNNEKIIGFLKTANRINVAFSRARQQLYCIGNFEFMAEKGGRTTVDHFPWHKLLQQLRKQNVIGAALEICCQTHGTKNMVSTKEDFSKKAPEGGCLNVCNTVLLCGHLCLRACHIFNKNAEHARLLRNCNNRCSRSCTTGHPCPLKCHYSKACGKCTVSVVKSRTVCPHAVRIPCWQSPSSVQCVEKVLTNAPCGHTVYIECSDAKNYLKLLSNCVALCNVEPKCAERHICPDSCHYPRPCGKCIVEVDKLRKECQHSVRVACWLNPSGSFCPNPCEKYRSCGHKCEDVCGTICDVIICTVKVEAKSPCGHTVTIDCSDAKSNLKLLSKCDEPCSIELKCGHTCKGSCSRCKYGRLHIRYFLRI